MLAKIKDSIKQTIIYSIGNGAIKLSGIILLPIYSKYIPIQDYGILALFEVAFLFFSSFACLRLEDALQRWYWDLDSKKQKSIFFTVFSFSAISSLFFSVILFFILERFSIVLFDKKFSQTFILIFTLNSLIKTIVNVPFQLFRIQQKAGSYSVYSIIRLVIFITLVYISVVKLNKGLIGIFTSELIASVVIFLPILVYALKNCIFKFERSILKSMIKFSYPLILSASLGLILTLSDRYIIKFFASLEDVGVYALGYKISNILLVLVIQSFMLGYTQIYYKQMADKNSDRFFIKSVTYFLFALVQISLIIVLFSREIIKVLTVSDQYWPAFLILPYLMLAVVLSGLRQILGLPLKKLKKTKILSMITISAGILNIVLNILFVPHWEAIGAAVATIITSTAVIIVTLVFIWSHNKIKLELGNMAKLFCLSIAFFFIGSSMNESPLITRLAIKSLLIIAFPVVLYFTKFFEQIEIDRIKGFWSKWRNPYMWKENINNKTHA